MIFAKDISKAPWQNEENKRVIACFFLNQGGKLHFIMITLSKITRNPSNPQEIYPFFGRELVLWGGDQCEEKITTILNQFHLCPSQYVHPQAEFWGTEKNGKLILSPDIFFQLYPDPAQVVVQLALSWSEEEKWRDLLQEKGYFFVIHGAEAQEILLFFQQTTNPTLLLPQQEKNQLIEVLKSEEYAISSKDTPLFLCLPPKTGDHTLINTLKQKNIPHHFTFHLPTAVPMDYPGPMKIITAVREPLAELISFLYQVLGDLSHSFTAHYLCKQKEPNFFLQEAGEFGDIQLLFSHLCRGIQEKNFFSAPPLPLFLDGFFQHILDLTQFPFDQEKGFAWIKQENLSIFIYQIEKLDHLLPQLSEFLGTELHSLEKGNRTQEKWVARSYVQAQKELQFSAEFVSELYEKPWYSHFYSQKDREFAQQKWHNQITLP